MIRGRTWPRARTAILAALLVVASAAAVSFGISAATSADSDTVAVAAQRDAALRQGEQAMSTLNTLEYRTAEAGLGRWEEATTGTLKAQIRAGRAAMLKTVTSARTSTTAKIIRAALTSWDSAGGRARMMALLDVTVRSANGKEQIKRVRLLADLIRDGDRWALSALAPVPSRSDSPKENP